MEIRKFASSPMVVWLFSGIIGQILMSSSTSSASETGAKAQGRLKPIHLVTCGITAGVCAVLALFAIILVPIPGLPAASGFWIPAGFYFTFTLWFGIWGAIGGHIATFLGMGYFSGFTLIVWLDGSVGDFLAPFVALIIFRALKADPGLATKRDWIIWLVSVPFSSLICGLWVHSINAMFGVIAGGIGGPFWKLGVVTYLIGDSLAIFTIATPLLKTLTKYIKLTPAYVEGIFY